MVLDNLFLPNNGDEISYRPRSKVIPARQLPERNHEEYGRILENKFMRAWDNQENNGRNAIGISGRDKVFIEYVSEPGEEIPINSIEALRSHIRVLNVREEKKDDGQVITKTLVSFPKSKQRVVLNKLNRYIQNNRGDKTWSVVNDIRDATLESLWTGPRHQFIDEENRWYELWFHNDEDSDLTVELLSLELEQENVQFQNDFLVFPEKIVVLVFLNSLRLKELIININSISEVRPATNINNFILGLDNDDQYQWSEDFVERLHSNFSSNTFVTILDGGVNNSNPLIAPVMNSQDRKTYDASWGVADNSGHGTNMAGIAAYFKISDKLVSNTMIQINHRLESGKIMKDSTGSGVDPKLYGAIIKQVVSDLAIEFPDRKRVYCMAVTGENNVSSDDGRPTSWSAAIDDFSFGRIDAEKKLFIISAGNIRDDLNAIAAYPQTQKVMSIENPGQSWNAITVGAITEIHKITEEGFENVADYGQLSPFTRTSLSWENKKWPIKPEIVLEGGNARLINNQGLTSEDSGVLTTNNDFGNNVFDVMHGTSPATAQAAFIAAELRNRYPDAWPETIRALMIHSASWTPQIEKQLLEGTKKGDYENVLRCVGYGIPSLDRAIECVEKRVNLIIESELQPFTIKDNHTKSNEMKIYKLPWPKEELQYLHDSEVELKVTLSYFIEPGPGEKGWNNRYRYPSVGLRFDINGPLDTKETFMQRINQEMITEGESYDGAGSVEWKYGVSRNVGSIHSDSWTSTGADIANSEYIAVYPLSGWWKERKWLNRYNDKIRFSLVVSVESKKEVDLYTPIYNQIHVPIKIENKASSGVKL